MKTHQELYLIPSDHIRFLRFLEAMRSVSPDWKNTPDDEKHLKELGVESRVFQHQGSKKAILLILQPVSESRELPEGTWYVSNVRPVEVGSVELDEYNHTVQVFKGLITPLAAHYGVTLRLTGDTVSFEDHYPLSAPKLKQFSGMANKSTGKGHPLDAERWNEFLITLFDESRGRSVDTKLLDDALKSQGWAERHRTDLISSYYDVFEVLNLLAKQGRLV